MKDENISSYNLRLPEDVKKRLEEEAKKEKRSLNSHIVYLLEATLKNSLELQQKELVLPV